MTTTLTLHIKKSAIEQAENYAEHHRTDLSKLVEDYLLSLPETKEPLINPLVESLTGVIPNRNTDDYKREYQEYLEKKYL